MTAHLSRLGLFTAVVLSAAVLAAQELPENSSGVAEYYDVAGRPCFVFLPKIKDAGPQPWVFYAPAFRGRYPDTHEGWMHEQFLKAGVAVAGIDVGEAYGSPKGRESFDAFYKSLVERDFATKPCLLGRSRGGLWVTSWAGANPDKVAGLAGIYPVFDFRTYPGLEKAAGAYEMSAAELEKKVAELNPIEQAGNLAKAKIPVYFIHGDVDKVVPLKENSLEFVTRYKAAGAANLAELTVPAGQGHNFWEGFFRDPKLIAFTIAKAKAGAEAK